MEFFYVHNVFLCFLNLTALMKLSETNASFFMKIVIELLQTYGTFSCLSNFFMLRESMDAFPYLRKLLMLMKSFYAQETFTSLWNFFILMELFHTCKTFPFSQSFIMLTEPFPAYINFPFLSIFLILMETVHGCRKIPC